MRPFAHPSSVNVPSFPTFPSRDAAPSENGRPSVLIVDPSAENREVLRTALERRGWATLEASKKGQAAELVRNFHPQLILVDADSYVAEAPSSGGVSDDPSSVERDFYDGATASDCDDAPYLVVLCSAPRPKSSAPHTEYVAKPYHYAPLVRRIEELLAAAQSAPARRAA